MGYFDAYEKIFPAGEKHDELTEKVIGAAIEVHRHIGPGHLESTYELALCHEFDLVGIKYQRQAPIWVSYKGKKVGDGKIDLLVEGALIVELKAVDSLSPVHRAQCIAYLRATGLHIALLINFNVAILKDGIKRVVLTKQ